MSLVMPKYHCYKCGHDWIPRRTQRPALCPNCNYARFDDPGSLANPINPGESVTGAPKPTGNAKVDFVALEDLSKKLTQAIAEVQSERKLNLSEEEVKLAKRLIRILREADAHTKELLLGEMHNAEMEIGARAGKDRKKKTG